MKKLAIVAALQMTLATSALAEDIACQGHCAFTFHPDGGDIPSLTAAAEKGDADAEYRLGYGYHFGLGLKIDHVKALEWWTKSADQNNPHAEMMLGAAYAEGWGVPPDGARALKLYHKAADQNDPDAKFILATVYEYAHDGVLHDHAKAEALWKESLPALHVLAEKGNVEAQCDLGTAYNKGWGEKRDDAESFKWRLKAAESGHPMGQLAVAFNYHNGWGTAKDEAKAVAWIGKAAEQGEPTAQLEFGKAYAKAVDVPKDPVKAYMWLDLALVQGREEAGPIMMNLARSSMTFTQVQEATKASHEWQLRHLAQADGSP